MSPPPGKGNGALLPDAAPESSGRSEHSRRTFRYKPQQVPPRTKPAWLLEKQRSCPNAGAGVHEFIFSLARQLWSHHTAAEIVQILTEATAHLPEDRKCDLPREIRDAVQNSQGVSWQPTAGFSAQGRVSGQVLPAGTPSIRPKWPKADPKRQEQALRETRATIEILRERSPTEVALLEAEEVLDTLFPGDPFLCFGKSEREFAAARREEFRGMAAMLPLMVPSPMIAEEGETKAGHKSAHSLANTGPRKFLAVEFDPPKWEGIGETEQAKHGSKESYVLAKLDEQAALLLYLARLAPLAVVTYSGSRSLHGWFHCPNQDGAMLHAFMRYAVALGADKAGWAPLQFSRVPGGTHQNGSRQTIHFFNPGVLK